MGLGTFTAVGPGFSPYWGTRIPQAARLGKKKKKKKRKKMGIIFNLAVQRGVVRIK